MRASFEAAIDSSADTTKTILLLVDLDVPLVPVVPVVAVVDWESVLMRFTTGGGVDSVTGVLVDGGGASLAGVGAS